MTRRTGAEEWRNAGRRVTSDRVLASGKVLSWKFRLVERHIPEAIAYSSRRSKGLFVYFAGTDTT
jgi:hypothetical protein